MVVKKRRKRKFNLWERAPMLCMTLVALAAVALVVGAFVIRKTIPVSYTHLDVYKRQIHILCKVIKAVSVLR